MYYGIFISDIFEEQKYKGYFIENMFSMCDTYDNVYILGMLPKENVSP
jgi:hypothetical protein